MKREFSLLTLLFFILLFFQQFFIKQLLPIPSDTIIGLYHPFRDLYAKDYPRGIPYKNFLITDPVLQQYPWRKLAISLEKQMEIPLWNPYSFSGMPLMANLQSAAFYPFNILFSLFSFPLAWSFLILIQPILAGFFMYLYLRNLRLSGLASLFGAFIFAFSGFSLVWLEWGTIVQTGLWLPAVLLSADKLITASGKKSIISWALFFVIALSFSLFAGHLQTFFYLSLVTFFHVFAMVWEQKAFKRLGLFIVLFGFFLVITLIQWMPLMQLIQLSARNIDHISFNAVGWFIPWQHLAQFIAPDFFGNPATLNYWGAWNYMEFSGYVGLFPLVFALFALLFVRLKKVYFFGALLFVSLLFALPNPIAKLPFILNIPFVETSQPTRLLFVVDFCLAVLAAIGFSSVRKESKLWYPFLLIAALLISLWGIVMLHTKVGLSVEQALVAKQNLIFPTIILSLIFIALLIFQLIKQTKKGIIILAFLVVAITCFDLFRFGYKFLPFTPSQYLFPQTKALAFLESNAGNYRIMETSREVMSPNIADIYHLQSVDGYDPLYLQRYGEFIAASERGKPDINPPFGFNRIITPHNYNSALINLLGVKYILSLQDVSDKSMKKVFQEGDTRVYENASVLPRTFFVTRIKMVHSKQDAITNLFAVQNDLLHTAIVESDQQLSAEYSQGGVQIQTYSSNKIVITTNNEHKGFLVLSDVYYPTWHASVDGRQINIFITDFAFRGIEVPSGNHTIVFQDSLF